jgi:hypothetical protein
MSKHELNPLNYARERDFVEKTTFPRINTDLKGTFKSLRTVLR